MDLATLLMLSALGGGPATAGPVPAEPSAPLLAEADTVLRVRRGERLVLRDLEGSVVVRGVGGDQLTLSGTAGSVVRRSDDRIVHEGRSRPRELRVDVPRGVPVEIRGNDLDVVVRGLRGGLVVRTLEGDIEIDDVEGSVEVRSVDGEIRARDLSGDVLLQTVDEDIRVRGVRGSLRAGTTDGDVTVEDADVETLEATTTDGDVVFSGAFRRGGRYGLLTHSGDITVTIPPRTDVEVEVSTFSGAFRAGFPVTVDGFRSGRSTAFTLGAGGAHLRLEAFSGDVVVRHPGG